MSVSGTRWANVLEIKRRPLILLGAAAVLTLLSLLLINSLPFNLDEGEARFWDIVLKGMGGLAVITGSGIALSKHFAERTLANEARLAEARKPFVETRQRVYLELVEATGTIGNIADPRDNAREEASKRFWRLYWSVAPMVSDAQVAGALDLYSKVLSDLPDDGVALRNASMDLARACGASLQFNKFLR